MIKHSLVVNEVCYYNIFSLCNNIKDNSYIDRWYYNILRECN